MRFEVRRQSGQEPHSREEGDYSSETPHRGGRAGVTPLGGAALCNAQISPPGGSDSPGLGPPPGGTEARACPITSDQDSRADEEPSPCSSHSPKTVSR